MRKSVMLVAIWAAAGSASAQYARYTPPKPQTGTEWLTLCERARKACSDALFDLTWELGYGHGAGRSASPTTPRSKASPTGRRRGSEPVRASPTALSRRLRTAPSWRLNAAADREGRP